MALDGKARRGLGVLLIAGSAIAYSTAGFFTRLIPLDVWTLLFWRGIFSGLFIAGILFAMHRRRTWLVLQGLGWPGLSVALASTCGMVLYVHALRQTTVADVAIIYAASPFVTAALVWLSFGERQTRSTIFASLAALLGVSIMVGGAVGEGHLLGDILALGMTVCVAAMMILVHRYPNTPMLGAVCLSSFLTAIVVWPLAEPWRVDAADMGGLVLFGVTQLGLGLLLLTLGTRLLAATESALVGTLDVPLAPIWVWVAFDEVPSWQTGIDGAVVMLGVFAHILLSPRSGRLSG